MFSSNEEDGPVWDGPGSGRRVVCWGFDSGRTCVTEGSVGTGWTQEESASRAGLLLALFIPMGMLAACNTRMWAEDGCTASVPERAPIFG